MLIIGFWSSQMTGRNLWRTLDDGEVQSKRRKREEKGSLRAVCQRRRQCLTAGDPCGLSELDSHYTFLCSTLTKVSIMTPPILLALAFHRIFPSFAASPDSIAVVSMRCDATRYDAAHQTASLTPHNAATPSNPSIPSLRPPIVVA